MHTLRYTTTGSLLLFAEMRCTPQQEAQATQALSNTKVTVYKLQLHAEIGYSAVASTPKHDMGRMSYKQVSVAV